MHLIFPLLRLDCGLDAVGRRALGMLRCGRALVVVQTYVGPPKTHGETRPGISAPLKAKEQQRNVPFSGKKRDKM